jgi:hypothetical protein
LNLQKNPDRKMKTQIQHGQQNINFFNRSALDSMRIRIQREKPMRIRLLDRQSLIERLDRFTVFVYFGKFPSSWIRIRIPNTDLDPDLEDSNNADLDPDPEEPNHCGSGFTTLFNSLQRTPEDVHRVP